MLMMMVVMRVDAPFLLSGDLHHCIIGSRTKRDASSGHVD